MNKKLKSFTMAEILLSLTIIGVVAAITLPSLTGNINERTWNTQRKALYARMSQAIALMGSLNGYGLNADSNQTISNAAKIFVTNGLSKNLKINNICDYEHIQDCGISSKIVTLQNSKINIPTNLLETLYSANARIITNSTNYLSTKAAAFETANGENILVYYNPFCKSDDFNKNEPPENDTEVVEAGGNTFPYLCANFVYDLNGKKGPNTIGKDIGTISVFYATDSYVVNPVITKKTESGSYYDAIAKCKAWGDEYRLPTIEEWMGLYVNYMFFDFSASNRFWSISSIDENRAWTMYPSYGIRTYLTKTRPNFSIRCIKR